MPSKIEYAAVILFLGVLCSFSIYNYLIFHTIVELFCVIIALGIASLAWHGRHFIDNGFYIVLGFAYILVGLFDLFHAISYKNMGFFVKETSNLPTQFWIASRYFESVSFFIAPFFIIRKNFIPIFLAYSVIFIEIFLNILWFKNFPDCYIEGEGLTQFKIVSEYLIIIIFFAALAHILLKKQHFDEQMLRWLILSLFTSIIAEICFTLYVGVYDSINIIGHCFRFVSYYFAYKAFIETSFTRPFHSLFKELQYSEQLFRTYFNLPLMGKAIIAYQDQKWIQVNEKFYELLGHSKESLKEETWESLTHPKDWESEKHKIVSIERSLLDSYSYEKRFIRGDGNILEAEISLACVRNKQGTPDYFVVIIADIGQRKDAEREKELLISDLKEALLDIQTLQALIPICPSCHSVKDDQGYWIRVEDYITKYMPMKIKYTFCDECLKKQHPELLEIRKTLHQYQTYLSKSRTFKSHKIKP